MTMNYGTLGIGLLIGAVVAGTIALLYAPRTGRETREMIRSRMRGWRSHREATVGGEWSSK